MKTTLGIILGVILGAVIIIIIVWGLFSKFSPVSPKSSVSGIPALSPSPTTTVVPPPSINTPPVSSQPAVNFSLKITNFNVSGLTSGTINAQLTDTGTASAHNIWAKVEVFSKGSRIKIDGQEYFRKDIGTVQAGETIATQVTLNISALDAPKIMQNGATFNLTIYSDEKTQTFSYNYP